MKPLRNRVGHYVDLGQESFESLSALPHRIETRRPGEEIVAIGETVDYVFVIETGWAIRYRILDDGRRQIVNFMLPGACFDMMSMAYAKADHAVSAVTEVRLRRLKSADFLKAVSMRPKLATAFWWVAIQEEAILREQIVRIGRRSAKERVSHLLLELNRRIAAIEEKLTDFINLPFPQALFADALGLSVVHVSRTLTKLKAEGMISTSPEGIEILDRDRMAEMCDFDSRYLHLERLKLVD
ncbi:Crp/Fnr family transcriptional regulator [Hellea balneolensis]|uniref:Crp/Fnr family transcriptional regulator n=1 Tax=Hellea balneolensis TaxID=287478 RepID=UPI00040375DD|nr:Crp/Fnr family transcriptional regulator [Hellea balneolensis]